MTDYTSLRRGVRRRAGAVGRRLATLDAPEPNPVMAPPPAPPAEPSPSPAPADEMPLLCWPIDHFYSPVANNRALSREPARSRVWPPAIPETPGVDWRAAEQEALLRALAGQPQRAFADGPTGDPTEYHAGNEMFSRLDAWVLQGILREFKPRRMIEVGCGWSSLVSAGVNREFLGRRLDLTCIEPYPPDFLESGVDGISRLVPARVEEVPVNTFLALEDGDVLFIDSSHTVKTGGDVAFLVGEVLPRLAPGVLVHFHDIFLPHEYPQDWVFSGRAWNEQYLVRAFLAFNAEFHVLLGVGWLSHHRRGLLEDALPNYPSAYGDGGGSLWIRRKSA